MELFLYIVFAMIIYDLSIHLIFLLKKQDIFLNRKLNYWPEWKDKSKAKVRYQQFWTAYWGVASTSMLIYLLSK